MRVRVLVLETEYLGAKTRTVLVARPQTPRVRWDVRLSTNQRREDLHHFGLLVVGSNAETNFGRVQKDRPEFDRLWHPVSNVM